MRLGEWVRGYGRADRIGWGLPGVVDASLVCRSHDAVPQKSSLSSGQDDDGRKRVRRSPAATPTRPVVAAEGAGESPPLRRATHRCGAAGRARRGPGCAVRVDGGARARGRAGGGARRARVRQGGRQGSYGRVACPRGAAPDSVLGPARQPPRRGGRRGPGRTLAAVDRRGGGGPRGDRSARARPPGRGRAMGCGASTQGEINPEDIEPTNHLRVLLLGSSGSGAPGPLAHVRRGSGGDALASRARPVGAGGQGVPRRRPTTGARRRPRLTDSRPRVCACLGPPRPGRQEHLLQAAAPALRRRLHGAGAAGGRLRAAVEPAAADE